MKKKYNIMLVVVLIICLGILILILNKNNNKINNNDIENKEIYSLVNDYNDFFTIENCANKYYNYLSNNDMDSINKLLDKDYKKNNQIINNYENKNISIKVNEMYNYKNKYYLKGFVYEELKNGVNKLDEAYLLIKLSDDLKLFNVTPIDINSYYGVINGE